MASDLRESQNLQSGRKNNKSKVSFMICADIEFFYSLVEDVYRFRATTVAQPLFLFTKRHQASDQVIIWFAAA